MEDRDKDPVVSVIMAGRDDSYGNVLDEGIRGLAFTPVLDEHKVLSQLTWHGESRKPALELYMNFQTLFSATM